MEKNAHTLVKNRQLGSTSLSIPNPARPGPKLRKSQAKIGRFKHKSQITNIKKPLYAETLMVLEGHTTLFHMKLSDFDNMK